MPTGDHRRAIFELYANRSFFASGDDGAALPLSVTKLGAPEPDMVEGGLCAGREELELVAAWPALEADGEGVAGAAFGASATGSAAFHAGHIATSASIASGSIGKIFRAPDFWSCVTIEKPDDMSNRTRVRPVGVSWIWTAS